MPGCAAIIIQGYRQAVHSMIISTLCISCKPTEFPVANYYRYIIDIDGRGYCCAVSFPQALPSRSFLGNTSYQRGRIESHGVRTIY